MRDLAQALRTALREHEITPFLLFEGDFDATVRLWTGIGTLVWDGHEWAGVGTLLDVSNMEESADVRSLDLTVELSGVPLENISLAIQDASQGDTAQVLMGLLSDDGQIVGDPVPMFRGRLDVPELEDNGESATVRISYVNQLVDLERPRGGRYTQESQKARFPQDRFFEHVAELQEKPITWGRRS